MLRSNSDLPLIFNEVNGIKIFDFLIYCLISEKKVKNKRNNNFFINKFGNHACMIHCPPKSIIHKYFICIYLLWASRQIYTSVTDSICSQFLDCILTKGLRIYYSKYSEGALLFSGVLDNLIAVIKITCNLLRGLTWSSAVKKIQ